MKLPPVQQPVQQPAKQQPAQQQLLPVTRPIQGQLSSISSNNNNNNDMQPNKRIAIDSDDSDTVFKKEHTCVCCQKFFSKQDNLFRLKVHFCFCSFLLSIRF